MATKPNAALAVEVTAPNGRQVRWDPDSPFPDDVPINPAFSTASGEGHTSASVTLNRPVNQDYDELGLLNRFRLIGASGDVAFDGRISGAPKGRTIEVNAYGWIAHGDQRKFTELLVDRDTSSWGATTPYRRLVQLAFNVVQDKNITSSSDDGSLVFDSGVTAIGNGERAEVAYTPPVGCLISAFGYLGTEANLTNVAAASVIAASADQVTTQDTYSLTLDGQRRVVTLTSQRQSLVLPAVNTAAFTPTVPFRRSVAPAVYGTSGLTRYKRQDGLDGYAASDVIKFLAAKYAPKLDTSKINTTTWPIPQIAWREPVTFNEAGKQLNGFHNWKFAVWDNAELDFGPYDYTVANWQVKNGEDGVRVEPQGDTTADVYNGCVVNFTDLSGTPQRISPLDTTSLQDNSEYIAANQWGEQAWMELNLSWIMSSADAALIGSIALAEANRAKRPCTITVPMHIKDINGIWHPSWEVRSDQTISVLNQSSPTPRLITGTSWQNHQLTISTDNTIDTLQAVQERIATALGAAGIGA